MDPLMLNYFVMVILIVVCLMLFFGWCLFLHKKVEKLTKDLKEAKEDLTRIGLAGNSAHQKISNLDNESRELKRQVHALRVDSSDKNFAKHGRVHTNIV